jgi:ABC-type sugar transport system permease subunit
MTPMHECQFHPLPTRPNVSLNPTDSDMVVSSNSYPEYIGTHVISTSSGESFHVTLTGDGTEELYQFCDQDFLERISALFSFFQQEKDDWMSPDQEVLTYLFRILCVVVLVILGCVALVFGVIPNMREVVGGDYVRAMFVISLRFLSSFINVLTFKYMLTAVDDDGARFGRYILCSTAH